MFGIFYIAPLILPTVVLWIGLVMYQVSFSSLCVSVKIREFLSPWRRFIAKSFEYSYEQ